MDLSINNKMIIESKLKTWFVFATYAMIVNMDRQDDQWQETKESY